jgi:hypothetical protein
MATRDDVFPSPWLKAADLNGKPAVVKIASAGFEKLKNQNGTEQNKLVLTFHNAKKKLPLNLVNFNSVVKITGQDNSDNWGGHPIELYPTQTDVQGELKDCIRIRKPSQSELGLAKAAPPKPALPPETEFTADPEMDDAIPF